jgi:outer membrane biosynthesis protein TonB
MSHLHNFAVIVLIALVSAAGLQPRQETENLTHFDRDGLVFYYPTGWTLTESQQDFVPVVTLQPPTGPTQIIVSTTSTSSCDFQAETKNIMSELVEQVARQIQASTPIQSSPVKTQVDTAEADGVRLLGKAQGKPVIADVYSVRVNTRFINLVYIRVENDEAGASAWNTVRTTVKIRHGVTTIIGSEAPNGSAAAISGGVLNGKAIRLPRPGYPPIARSAHASGTVVVQVTIDEWGAVSSAHAVSGHPLLMAVSVEAARGAVSHRLNCVTNQ